MCTNNEARGVAAGAASLTTCGTYETQEMARTPPDQGIASCLAGASTSRNAEDDALGPVVSDAHMEGFAALIDAIPPTIGGKTYELGEGPGHGIEKRL